MTPSTPIQHPLPSEGGSYIRESDGSLTRVACTVERADPEATDAAATDADGATAGDATAQEG